jgi:hypothetical protein
LGLFDSLFSRSREAVSSFLKGETVFLCNEAIFADGENGRTPKYGLIAADDQTTGFDHMWSIIAALIFNQIILPGWKLTTRDRAKVRGANCRRAA